MKGQINFSSKKSVKYSVENKKVNNPEVAK